MSHERDREMLIEDGHYVWKLFQIVFRDKPIEVAAVIRRRDGDSSWRVRGRVRVRRDHLSPEGTYDTKWWFESPDYASPNDASDAWETHLEGFAKESHLAIANRHDVPIGSAEPDRIYECLRRAGLTQALPGAPPNHPRARPPV